MKRVTAQRRDVDLRDELTQKGGLREDLGVEERRCRLEWNDRQLFEPMKLARGMDIEQRDRKNQTSRQAPSQRDPLSQPPAGLRPTTWSDWSMAFQKRVQVRLGPGLFSGRHQDQRQMRPLEAAVQRTAEVGSSNRNDASLDRPAQRPICSTSGATTASALSWARSVSRMIRMPALRQRFAANVDLKGVVAGLARGHAQLPATVAEMNEMFDGWRASQCSTSWR